MLRAAAGGVFHLQRRADDALRLFPVPGRGSDIARLFADILQGKPQFGSRHVGGAMRENADHRQGFGGEVFGKPGLRCLHGAVAGGDEQGFCLARRFLLQDVEQLREVFEHVHVHICLDITTGHAAQLLGQGAALAIVSPGAGVEDECGAVRFGHGAFVIVRRCLPPGPSRRRVLPCVVFQ